MELLVVIIGLVLLVMVGIWLFIVHQGDADIQFLVAQRTEFKLAALSDGMATFTCKVPFINRGTQDGTIMDAYTRHLLPYEQYDGVKVCSRLELEASPRMDGYWEALIVPVGTGQGVVVTAELTAAHGDIRQALSDMVDMPIDLVYQVVARSDWFITKTRIVLTTDEIAKAVATMRSQE